MKASILGKSVISISYCEILICFMLQSQKQRAKKVVSDNLGLVDFAIGPVNSVFYLPNGQVIFWGEIQITE